MCIVYTRLLPSTVREASEQLMASQVAPAGSLEKCSWSESEMVWKRDARSSDGGGRRGGEEERRRGGEAGSGDLRSVRVHTAWEGKLTKSVWPSAENPQEQVQLAGGSQRQLPVRSCPRICRHEERRTKCRRATQCMRRASERVRHIQAAHSKQKQYDVKHGCYPKSGRQRIQAHNGANSPCYPSGRQRRSAARMARAEEVSAATGTGSLIASR
jgi:hypothetical protein